MSEANLISEPILRSGRVRIVATAAAILLAGCGNNNGRVESSPSSTLPLEETAGLTVQKVGEIKGDYSESKHGNVHAYKYSYTDQDGNFHDCDLAVSENLGAGTSGVGLSCEITPPPTTITLPS